MSYQIPDELELPDGDRLVWTNVGWLRAGAASFGGVPVAGDYEEALLGASWLAHRVQVELAGGDTEQAAREAEALENVLDALHRRYLEETSGGDVGPDGFVS